MNKIIINLLILILFLPLLPFVENVKAENFNDFVVLDNSALEEDTNNDGFVDRLRIKFTVNTTNSQVPIIAKVITTLDHYPTPHEIIEWDNFTLTNEKSLSRSIFIDAWKEGSYQVLLKFFNPINGELLKEYDIGQFNLMVGLNKPSVVLSVIVKDQMSGSYVFDGFLTGSDCKIKREVLDDIGHRYNKTGEIQFIGAPWITPPLEPGNLIPNGDEINCTNWPAGDYSLKMIYHNSLGYSLETHNNFTIINRPAPEFILNVTTAENKEIGSLCFITIIPMDNTDFSQNQISWTTIPKHEISNILEADCKMWEPGVHRIIVNVTNTEGISSIKGVNIVRMPPIDSEASTWGNESVTSSWPVRSGGEIEKNVSGYIATGIGMLLLFLITILVLKKFGEDSSGEFSKTKSFIDSEGLPTHTDEEGHLWRQHPDGQIDWWDENANMWMPFQ